LNQQRKRSRTITSYDDSVKAKWNLAPDNEVHKHVFAAISTMDPLHSQRSHDNAKYLSLYENSDQQFPGVPSQYQNRFSNKLSFNIIKSCVDAVAAEIAKTKPKPEFITNNGDYRLQHKAELLTDYMAGVFYDNKVYTDHGPDVFKDAALFGTGALSVFNDGERIRFERTLIDEIYVDDYDGIYRKPKALMHVRRVFRDKVKERFQNDPKALQAINDAPDAPILHSIGQSDMILVAEAYYLPYKVRKPKATEKDSKPAKNKEGVAGGRYAVCLENYTLHVDEYKKDYFPFVFFRWANKTTGFLGQGLAEDLVPLQLEAAKTLQAIARGMRFGGLRVFIEEGSQVNPNHLDEDGTKGIPVTKYSGTPPVVATWPAASQEHYQHLENVYRKAYELSGVSQMMAFSQKPAGITAAKALETLNDNQSKRFLLTADRYEQFYMDLAEMVIDQSRDLYEENPELSIKTIANGFLKDIPWSKVDMDNDKFRMRAFPVNAFSDSPAARLQEVNSALQAGWLSKEQAQQLLEIMPDFQEQVSINTASLQRVRKALDDIKYDNEYSPPDIFMNLEEAQSVTTAQINLSITQGVEEEKVQMMRNYLDDIQELKGLGTPPAPPPGPQAPLAQPEPLPTSDMLPMQPGPPPQGPSN
jgi:hypothetical protein